MKHLISIFVAFALLGAVEATAGPSASITENGFLQLSFGQDLDRRYFPRGDDMTAEGDRSYSLVHTSFTDLIHGDQGADKLFISVSPALHSDSYISLTYDGSSMQFADGTVVPNFTVSVGTQPIEEPPNEEPPNEEPPNEEPPNEEPPNEEPPNEEPPNEEPPNEEPPNEEPPTEERPAQQNTQSRTSDVSVQGSSVSDNTITIRFSGSVQGSLSISHFGATSGDSLSDLTYRTVTSALASGSEVTLSIEPEEGKPLENEPVITYRYSGHGGLQDTDGDRVTSFTGMIEGHEIDPEDRNTNVVEFDWTPPDEDDEPLPEVYFSSHGDGTLPEHHIQEVSVRLSHTSSTTVTVYLSVTSSRTPARDYKVPASLEIPAGDDTGSFRVSAYEIDMPAGETENLTVSITGCDGCQLADDDTSFSVSVYDPVDISTVSIGASEYTVSEGDRLLRIPIELSEPFQQDIQVRYATASRTARAGVDYQAATGRLTIPAGAEKATVKVYFIDDDLVEEDEHFLFKLIEVSSQFGSNIFATITITDNDSDAASKVAVAPNTTYPNPFNSTVHIAYHLPVASDMALDIYNVLGQRVRSLVTGYQDAGHYYATWNARDDNGLSVSAGVYIVRVQYESKLTTQRILYLP